MAASSFETSVLGSRTAAEAVARHDDAAAYGALIGEAAIRGLNLVPPADHAGLTIEEGRWDLPPGAADDFVDDGAVGWFQVGVSRELTPATISLVCECAYAACRDVGPFRFQGLALRLPSERVVHDHSLATYIAERLPVYGEAAVRPVTIALDVRYGSPGDAVRAGAGGRRRRCAGGGARATQRPSYAVSSPAARVRRALRVAGSAASGGRCPSGQQALRE